MSRNRDRSGLTPSTPANTPTPPQLKEEGGAGGFSFVVPTEFVELPSEGRYYPPNHPLHNQETIEIKQMTAKEEDMLTSRSLLKKGIALERVMNSLIQTTGVKASGLLVGDRNAVLVAARISGYGATYTTQITCPACSATQEHSFNLHELEIYNGTDLAPEEAQSHGNGTFTTVLPSSKIEVTFRLLTGNDEKSFMQQIENARKKKQSEKVITRQMRQFIIAVNGSTEIEHINYVVENMPSVDSRHLRNVYKIATPNIDLTQHFECAECDHEQNLEVPLTADFFWPDR